VVKKVEMMKNRMHICASSVWILSLLMSSSQSEPHAEQHCQMAGMLPLSLRMKLSLAISYCQPMPGYPVGLTNLQVEELFDKGGPHCLETPVDKREHQPPCLFLTPARCGPKS